MPRGQRFERLVQIAKPLYPRHPAGEKCFAVNFHCRASQFGSQFGLCDGDFTDHVFHAIRFQNARTMNFRSGTVMRIAKSVRSNSNPFVMMTHFVEAVIVSSRTICPTSQSSALARSSFF